MLQPKRVKYRKVQKAKGNMKGNSGRGTQLSNGMFGLKSLDQDLLTSRQIEAARIAATRYMKREGQLWIKIFPDKPITKKPLEVRMGKGKGAPEYFCCCSETRKNHVRSWWSTNGRCKRSIAFSSTKVAC